MIIYVYSEYRTFHYMSDVVPRKNEILYFPHFGTFEVVAVIFNISDDNMIHTTEQNAQEGASHAD